MPILDILYKLYHPLSIIHYHLRVDLYCTNHAEKRIIIFHLQIKVFSYGYGILAPFGGQSDERLNSDAPGKLIDCKIAKDSGFLTHSEQNKHPATTTFGLFF